jgi:hypothetical protein
MGLISYYIIRNRRKIAREIKNKKNKLEDK